MDGIRNLNETMQINWEPSKEQLNICEEVARGGNHAIFGEAGTGKSSLIRLIVDKLNGMGRSVLCVAPTGIATRNLGIIGTQTIHRAFRLPEGLVENAILSLDCRKQVIPNTLIIDKISMVRSDIFTTVDRIMRIVKKTDSPFGDIQLIVVGDLMQIPPFTTDYHHHLYINQKYGSLHCFNTQSWKEADLKIHKLTIGHRQVDDPQFYRYLHAIHSCNIANCELAELNNKLISHYTPEENEPQCQLAWLKTTVKIINDGWIKVLLGLPVQFNATVNGDFPEDEYPVDACLILKPGAKVLLTANYYECGRPVYVNGDLGIFVGICNDKLLVRLDRNSELVEVSANTWEHYDYQVTDDNQCNCYCT